MKRYIWTPIAFFFAGLIFYIYYGITWNAWITNLPNLGIYLIIVLALSWSLKKKEELKRKREEEFGDNK